MHRLPVPFDLRSSGEGFQMKTWHWTGSQDDQGEESKIGGSTGADETDDGSYLCKIDEEYDQEDRDYQSSSSKMVSTRSLPAGSKALIGLRR
uniref:Uncharacterized protein n=1 Tax=Ditylenchus dipsaci TaxID=166011 RepID=A0A915ETT8_9BILA